MKNERTALWWIAAFGTCVAALDMIALHNFEAALQAAICGFVAGLTICITGAPRQKGEKKP